MTSVACRFRQVPCRARSSLPATRYLPAAVAACVALEFASAQDPPTAQGDPEAPDCTGDLARRRHLTGDWSGLRTRLAENGFELAIGVDQYYQKITEGGAERAGEYGSHINLLAELDLERLGAVPGGLLRVRLESRFGASVTEAAGVSMPVNSDAAFPETDPLDDDLPLALTGLNYTQALCSTFSVLLGKIDTLDGDANEFASGRGVTQFMNANFLYNGATAQRLPYSTLAAGVLWTPVQEQERALTVASTIWNTVDSSTSSGFDDIGDGCTWTSEVDFQYRIGTLPGGQNAGVLYAFDQSFADLSGRLSFRPGQGIIVPTTQDSWSVYWSGWQYLAAEPGDGPIDLANGTVDRKGWGVFARVGFADQDTNPVEWSLSLGLGGRGLLPGRDHDSFGVGWYYTDLQSNRFTTVINLAERTQGIEAYYDIAVTPAAHVTLDAQVVEPIDQTLGTAVILGIRCFLAF